MTTPRWLRVHRQKQAEQKRRPRYHTHLQRTNLKAFEDEMAAWSKHQIWTTGDNR